MPHIDMNIPGNFCWFELATTDQNAAKDFYHRLFGWDPTDSPMGPEEVYTIFKLEGRDAAAAYTMRPEQRAMHIPPNWMVYIAVESADDAVAQARRLGGKVHAGAFDVMDTGRMAIIEDTTGAVFAVWQPGTHSGVGVANVANSISWADLSSPDPARAAEFYTGMFGWQITTGKDNTPVGPDDYGHIVNNGNMIGGIPPVAARQPDMPAHWMIYVETADCAETAAKAKSLGGHVIVDTMAIGENGKIAVIGDPQGAVFALHQGT